MKHLLTRAVAAAALAALALASLAPSVAASERRAPAGATTVRFAFIRINATKSSIVTMREDGKQVRKPKSISAGSLFTSAELSPDGTQVLYARGFPQSTIWVAKANGKGAKKIVDIAGEAAFAPTWSPDGKRIAFVHSDLGTETAIVTAKANGKGRKKIHTDSGFLLAPTWSPDGKRIAFSAEVGPDILVKTVKSGGGGVKKLTKAGTGINIAGDWSPDGKRLAFTRMATVIRAPLSGSTLAALAGTAASAVPRGPGYGDVFTVKPTGKGLKRVTKDHKVLGKAVYSSDGTRILATQPTAETLDLYSIKVGNGKRKRLTKTNQTLNLFDYFSIIS